MPEIDPIKLPFEAAIEFFSAKTNLDTDSWRDTLDIDNDAVFTSAAAKGQLLQDIREAVAIAQSEGKSVADFLTQFDKIADRYSPDWLGKGDRAWRGQLIYEQNIRTAHNAGREQQMNDPDVVKLRPYQMWRHGDSRQPRPAHLALDGMVFEAGKVPLRCPAGFNCRCQIFSLSRREFVREGLSLSTLKLGDEIDGVKILPDPGFERTKAQVRKDTLDRFDPKLRKQVESEIGSAQFRLPEGSIRRRNGTNYILRNSRWHRADKQDYQPKSRVERASDIYELTQQFDRDMTHGTETYESVAERFLHDLMQLGDRDKAEERADKIDMSGVSDQQGTFLNAIDFYQLIDRDLGIVKIHADADRAHAIPDTNEIAIPDERSAKDRRSMQFHEMAHFTEFRDPELAQKTKEFVKNRRTGELAKLSDITGIDYDPSEVAYPDKFIDPYVGKVYQRNVTEVLSMGLEHFADPKSLADLYLRDREHFDFVMRYVRG